MTCRTPRRLVETFHDLKEPSGVMSLILTILLDPNSYHARWELGFSCVLRYAELFRANKDVGIRLPLSLVVTIVLSVRSRISA